MSENYTSKEKRDWKTVRFLFAGRLEEIKGIKYLLNAFKKLSEKYNNCELWVAGDGTMRDYVNNFYYQYDNQVYLYNEKFGKPALALMNTLSAVGLITTIPFDDKIEWTYFFLWHHEGRRARMGASMMGPDYTQWHGNFEVADRFYMEFVPEVKELIEHWKSHGKSSDARALEASLNDILNSELHQWFLG